MLTLVWLNFPLRYSIDVREHSLEDLISSNLYLHQLEIFSRLRSVHIERSLAFNKFCA